MKKLITLLILFVGMVSSVNAKTIYFIDNWGRSNLQLYAWTGSNNSGWIDLNTAYCYIGKSNGWHWCYALDLGNYENFLIKHDESDGRTQTPDLSSSDFEDGEYYEYYYDSGSSSEKLQKATLYTYTFNVTTATSWNNFYIYLFNGGTNITGQVWPGIEVTGSENAYTFTFKSYINTVGVLFNQGDGKPQTCNMTPTTGENNYYIAGVPATKIDDSWGLTVKTNASGYATWGDNWHAITIPSGIAYCAEDNGNGSATAHTVTNPAAYTPMIIKGEANTTYHFAPASGSENLGYANALIRGTGGALDSGSGPYNYILNGETFYAANGKIVGTNKAYLQLSKAATARALVFDDEETTGIAVVNASQKMNGEFFNLAGQRVAQPTKGLYIVNGKKVIMK